MIKTDKRLQHIRKFKVNGKTYTHYGRHKVNARNVKFDEFKKHFEERNKRVMTKEEISTFISGYNSGYKEAKIRKKKIEKLLSSSP